MRLKSLLIACLWMTIAVSPVFSGGGIRHNDDPLRVTFIKNPSKTPDYSYQQTLRDGEPWKNFLQRNGNWNVIFDENNAMPLRAFGKPVSIAGGDAKSVAWNFLSSSLEGFRVPMAELNFTSATENAKYRYVNFRQVHEGMEVLFSTVQIKMTLANKVMQFALECHPDIQLPAQPVISSASAGAFATAQVPGRLTVSVSPDLKILPVPGKFRYDYRKVYEIMVETTDEEGIPAKYYTLVDAVNGKILYRDNRVSHYSANTDINVTGSLYLTNPFDPSSVESMKYLKIVENSITNYTDNAGYLGLSTATPTTATVSLEGRWSKVRSNNVTPSWTVNLNPGQNNIDVDANTNIRQRSAYNSINTVHDFMKTKYPSFVGLDVSLNTNVDVAGNCNAFYDGTSVNFYATGGQCNATALVADVCYHEYGHGINDRFYQSIGATFQNGAMGEGYGDIWALGITGSPILGIGFFSADPTGYVRRYDINKKVYPQDLVGEVHADGEIIAGCFWDTYLNLGNLQQMMDLFSQSFYAGITGANGNEGVIFRNVLLEVLTLDDNDGDITNGTPNFCAITSAFAIHGITLGASLSLTHNEVLQAAPMAPISVTATLQGLGSGSNLNGFYRVGNTGSYNPFTFINTGGNNYEGTIPSQSAGTIVEYYMAVQDNCGTLTNIIPVNANAPNPNIPYYIMVGFNLLVHEDFDVFAGNWLTGIPGDNATTGIWIIDEPVPSYVGTALVQPGTQHTPGGLFCAVTGNASSPSAGAGDNDIDGGKTTLVSPVYDLSGHVNPAFSFYRWYSNDQGATPGTDYWQVYISGDGNNFVPVENTNVSDHSWRRFAFRVSDYITPTSTVSMRFVGEDANAGSLVEAALDDIMLWDEIPTGINTPNTLVSFELFPNPTSGMVNFKLGLTDRDLVTIHIFNNLGQEVYANLVEMEAGNHLISADLAQNDLKSGLYQAVISTSKNQRTVKFNLTR